MDLAQSCSSLQLLVVAQLGAAAYERGQGASTASSRFFARDEDGDNVKAERECASEPSNELC